MLSGLDLVGQLLLVLQLGSAETRMGCCLERVSFRDEIPRVRNVMMLSLQPKTSIDEEMKMIKAMSALPQSLGAERTQQVAVLDSCAATHRTLVNTYV